VGCVLKVQVGDPLGRYLQHPRILTPNIFDSSVCTLWLLYKEETTTCKKNILLKHPRCFKIRFTFGHKLHYEIKATFGEISLKLRQTDWNASRINVNVVVGEVPSSNNNSHLFNN
jgi:hypothetical protein